MTLREQEVAAVFAQLTGGAARDPLDTPSLLATLAEGGRRLFHARGAKVGYVPGGRSPVLTGGTDAALGALAADAARWGEGAGYDARTTGCALVDVDVTARSAQLRWPRWSARARALGFGRATALPLHGRDGEIGSLVLFTAADKPLDEGDLALVQGFAEVAGHTLALQRELSESRVLTGQLEHALSSRVVVEQAKGILAARHGLSLDEAFSGLRSYARSHRRKLADVAREVTEGRTELLAR
ncbi:MULTISPECIES: ANTAR domain-containing response regulator [unclassified Streptomyces]|uniref:ANTAR domain-containing response regulator n=1 Tax=unclassified Streptomyces TaxID=2593676 RepID=UPI00278C83DD|nr:MULTISPECIES: ANTAR domain-containing protein [unclassified Streptomyces]